MLGEEKTEVERELVKATDKVQGINKYNVLQFGALYYEATAQLDRARQSCEDALAIEGDHSTIIVRRCLQRLQ